LAYRNVLHISKLEDLKNWLISKGWTIKIPKGEYEVLRAIKDGEKPLIVFTSLKIREHYSVPDCHIKLIYKFINEMRK
jgi:hypothetical protein